MFAQRIVSTGFAAVAAAAAFASAAQAQTAQRCAPRADLIKQLSSLYRETPVAFGVADNGNLMEVLAANDGATWTVLVTRTSGVSCVMLTGQGWQAEPPQTMASLPKSDLAH
jgi:hypothetical protein